MKNLRGTAQKAGACVFPKYVVNLLQNELFRIVYFIVWIDFMFKAYVAVIENDICTNTQPNVKE